MSKKILVTGSAGLIGSEAVRFFCSLGRDVVGIDNNMREYFFGSEASTDWNRELLEREYKNYKHYKADIRESSAIEAIFKENDFDLIIHTAAQPSHDWAAQEPLTDFSVNATGTLILLEAFKKYCPEAVFIFTSTNKVYGDTPNKLPLVELETRWEVDPTHPYKNGIDEKMNIDDSKHSIFGASKLSADIMVQEYGRYFNLHTGVFRGGCLTGPAHSGTKLHGFLAYLIKCIAEGIPYSIFGYRGKQVRDNIHSSDLVSCFYEFYKNPRMAEVYNIGGSRFANVSMMEAIEKTEQILGRKGNISYVDTNREGDHIWYVSDVSKFQNHYPNWKYKYDIDSTIQEICDMGHFSKPTIIGSSVVSKINYGGNTKVFVSAHVNEVYGHVQALKSYLIKRFPRFTFVEHPFAYSGISHSKIGEYRSSLPSAEDTGKKTTSEIFLYLTNLLMTMYWFIKNASDSRLFIGIDSLNTIAGVFLKSFGYKFTLVYYSTDFSTKRFKNVLLNALYHHIDTICVKYSDYIWSSTDRILTVRKSQTMDDVKNILVESGVDLEKIKPNDEKNRNTLVVVEHLTEIKNVQLVISSFKKILEINPQATLVVYGTGPYEHSLKDLTEKEGVADYVLFKGAVDHDLYLKEISKYGIGIALHKSINTSSYFSDPLYIKEYFAAGLPVIISDVLWLARDVTTKNLGVSITPTTNDLISALNALWNNPNAYAQTALNAKKYVESFAWLEVFDKAFNAIKFLKDSEFPFRNQNIAIVTHEFFKGSGQELKEFLIDHKANQVSYVAHMFYYAKNSVSYLENYISGELVTKRESIKMPPYEFLLYLRDILYTFKFLLFSKGKIDLYIGVNSFNAILGVLLKKLGKVDKVVFFTIDYIMHNRFKNPLLNKLYVFMDRFAFTYSDFTWNVSDRMSKQRILDIGSDAEKKTQLVVPIGVPIKDATKINVTKKNNVLVYSGSLAKDFGLELLVNSVPELAKKFPDLEVRIIGSGPIEEMLKKRVAELGVSQFVNFMGHIDTTRERERWLRLLKESTLGIATYDENDTTYKRYSDVTKPKDYMSCGLPIITTAVIPISEDTQKFNLGRVVEYNTASFVKEISSLLVNTSELRTIEQNVFNYSRDMTWENIFQNAFSEINS